MNEIRQGCKPLLPKLFTATLESSVGQLNWNINKTTKIGRGSINNLHVLKKKRNVLFVLFMPFLKNVIIRSFS